MNILCTIIRTTNNLYNWVTFSYKALVLFHLHRFNSQLFTRNLVKLIFLQAMTYHSVVETFMNVYTRFNIFFYLSCLSKNLFGICVLFHADNKKITVMPFNFFVFHKFFVLI